MNADLYIRVSTDEQAEKGFSQRDQEERLRRYCEIKGIDVRKVIYEDHSAKTFNRPQWQSMLKELRRRRGNVDLILFTKWDRFSRNTGDAYQMISVLRNLGAEPQAIEQPLDMDVPENKMMLAFYLAAPEVENDRRALNVRHGMRRGRKEGRWMGRAPIGYLNKMTEDGRKYITIDAVQGPLIKWGFEAIATGQFHVEQVFYQAKEKGLTCSRNAFWNALRNPIYHGGILIKRYKDEAETVAKGHHAPLITEALFLTVQDFLDGRKRNYKTTIGAKDEYQLRGYLICHKCGKLLTASASKGRVGEYYNYYHCHSGCRVRFRVEEVNEEFEKNLQKLFPKPGMTKLYAAVINDTYKKKYAQGNGEAKQLTAKLTALNEDISKARKKFLTDRINEKDYREFKKECEDEMNRVETRLLAVASEGNNISTYIDKAAQNLSNVRQMYEDMDCGGRRRIIGSMFPEKLVFDGKVLRTKRVNDAVWLIFNGGEGSSGNENGETDAKIDFSICVARPGFEPRQTAPKTVVLPLYYQAILSNQNPGLGSKNKAALELFQIF